MEILGIIPARSGSKGIINKNIKYLGSKPLISYTFQSAKKSSRLSRLILSTDSQEILEIGKRGNIETPFLRPGKISRDSSPAYDYIHHCLDFLKGSEGYQPQIIVILQPTSPFRRPEDIDACIDILEKQKTDSVVSVTPLPAKFHYAWQLTIKEKGNLSLYNGKSLHEIITHRQQLPPVYTRNGAVYAFWYNTFSQMKSIYGERSAAYIMPEENSINIDDMDDWEKAERLLEKGFKGGGVKKSNISNTHTVKYGLPEEVVFCKKCVLSNQRPLPTGEFKTHHESPKKTAFFDDKGVCSACRYSEMKDKIINWEEREKELIDLCDKFRKKDGNYDCIVPGSGGKDSVFASKILKDKYGMHPLTVTWAPHIYTDIGRKNFTKWIHSGFDNISITPNGRIHSLLTKLAFENLLHPFQPFVLGQRFAGLRMAQKFNIPLIFHGESPFEYGSLSITEAEEKGFRKEYFCHDGEMDSIYLGGVNVPDLIDQYNIDLNDLQLYLPLSLKEFQEFPMEYHFLGYYIKWDPQEAYYYSVEHSGFESNPERTEGTYSKYASLDDRIDGFHYYTSFIKFGLGRATMDAAQEIRNHKITREEGVALVKRYDGEFPKKYFKEVLDYMDLTEEDFWRYINAARSPHLWEKKCNGWALLHTVS